MSLVVPVNALLQLGLTCHRYEAKKVLKSQTDTDDSEIQFILEYYSLVREGKTNYVATTAFRDVTSDEPQQPVDFFRSYFEEFAPKKGAKRRKVDGVRCSGRSALYM